LEDRGQGSTVGAHPASPRAFFLTSITVKHIPVVQEKESTLGHSSNFMPVPERERDSNVIVAIAIVRHPTSQKVIAAEMADSRHIYLQDTFFECREWLQEWRIHIFSEDDARYFVDKSVYERGWGLYLDVRKLSNAHTVHH